MVCIIYEYIPRLNGLIVFFIFIRLHFSFKFQCNLRILRIRNILEGYVRRKLTENLVKRFITVIKNQKEYNLRFFN